MLISPLLQLREFAIAKNHQTDVWEDALVLKDVCNPGNNFKIYQADGYYNVVTIHVSKADYEYMAKCMVYLLLAEFNKFNADKQHLHINFKVNL